MKLNNIDLERVIPAFMREDENFQGFMYALENEMKRIFTSIDLIKLYTNLDGIAEDILDEIAWQFNIPEYEKTFDIETKRALINGCMSIHHKRGTVSAVQEVAAKLFGNAEIEEWFEYGGEPYHFKVTTTNISSSDEMLDLLTRIIKSTQNVRSHLEQVIIEVMNMMEMYIGGIVFQIDEDEFQTVNYSE